MSRESCEDLAHHPHTLHAPIAVKKAIAVELRHLMLSPLDDLLPVVREFINPDVSRVVLNRCLLRHGVSNQHKLQAKAQADAGVIGLPPSKTFRFCARRHQVPAPDA